jgi:hypothetical protein
MTYERIKALIEYLEKGGLAIRLAGDRRHWAFNGAERYWVDSNGSVYAFHYVFGFADWEPDIPEHAS